MDVDMDTDVAHTSIGSSPSSLKRRRRDSTDSEPISSTFLPPPTHPASPATPYPHRTKRRLLSPSRSLTDIQQSSLDLYIHATYKPYWFEDGDVLLVISDHLFQLPRRILACSEIFEDMFCLAQPEPVSDISGHGYEGPAPIFLDDNPQDWMVLLQWIDDPECVSFLLCVCGY